MIRITQNSITAAAGAEVTSDVLSGLEGLKRTILAVIPEQTASVDLVCYLDTDKVVNMPSTAYGAYCDPKIALDLPVSVGRTFKVGWKNGTGGSVTKIVTTIYREE